MITRKYTASYDTKIDVLKMFENISMSADDDFVQQRTLSDVVGYINKGKYWLS